MSRFPVMKSPVKPTKQKANADEHRTRAPGVLKANQNTHRVLESPRKKRNVSTMFNKDPKNGWTSADSSRLNKTGFKGICKAPTIESRRAKKNKKSEHPLSVEFSESLNESTVAVAHRLFEELTDAHSIHMSKIAVATSDSQSILDLADSERTKLMATPRLTTEFQLRQDAFKQFVLDKQAKLRELWKEHEAITQEIAHMKQELLSITSTSFLPRTEDEEEDLDEEAFMENMAEEVKAVGEKWMKLLEQNEKDFDAKDKKQRQIAADAMF